MILGRWLKRPELVMSVFIGLTSGVAVSLAISATSGVQLLRSPGVAASIEPSPAPTAQPTAQATLEATSAATAQPSALAAVEPVFESVVVMLGLPAQGGKPGVTTPVATLGEYITWTASVGTANAGKPIDVEVAARLQGRWTGWSTLTSRVADAQGAVVFSWRQRTPTWISVRFAHPALPSTALQGRWR
jgi:hypothetical protein